MHWSVLTQRALVSILFNAFIYISKTSLASQQQLTFLAIENIPLLMGLCIPCSSQVCLRQPEARDGDGRVGQAACTWSPKPPKLTNPFAQVLAHWSNKWMRENLAKEGAGLPAALKFHYIFPLCELPKLDKFLSVGFLTSLKWTFKKVIGKLSKFHIIKFLWEHALSQNPYFDYFFEKRGC